MKKWQIVIKASFCTLSKQYLSDAGVEFFLHFKMYKPQ